MKEQEHLSILDVAPEQAKNTPGKCVCDKCESTFPPEDTLMSACNNIQFQGLMGVKGITKGKNTYYMYSPCCKEVHLFGFNTVQSQSYETNLINHRLH